jgi:hypothetical protein
VKSGDKVVCVRDGQWKIVVDRGCPEYHSHPIKDEIYRIKTLWPYNDGYCGLELYGFEGRTYDMRNFRPVDERFGPDICGRIEQEILEQKLEVEHEILFI